MAQRDPRFRVLGMALGAPQRFAQRYGLGCMLAVWEWCTERGTRSLLIDDIAALLETTVPKAENALRSSRLAREEGEVWKIAGTGDRTDWLSKARGEGTDATVALRRAICDAIDDGCSSANAIAKAVGGTRDKVLGEIRSMLDDGVLARDGKVVRVTGSRTSAEPVAGPVPNWSGTGPIAITTAIELSSESSAPGARAHGSSPELVREPVAGPVPNQQDTEPPAISEPQQAPTIQALSKTETVIAKVHGRSLCMPALLEHQHELRRQVDPDCRRVPMSTGHDQVMHQALARFAPSQIVHALEMFRVEAEIKGHLRYFDGRANWELKSLERMVAVTEKDLRAAHRERQRGRPLPDEPSARKLVRL